MDQVEPVHEGEGFAALARDATQPWQRKVGLAASLPIVARELV